MGLSLGEVVNKIFGERSWISEKLHGSSGAYLPEDIQRQVDAIINHEATWSLEDHYRDYQADLRVLEERQAEWDRAVGKAGLAWGVVIFGAGAYELFNQFTDPESAPVVGGAAILTAIIRSGYVAHVGSRFRKALRETEYRAQVIIAYAQAHPEEMQQAGETGEKLLEYKNPRFEKKSNTKYHELQRLDTLMQTYLGILHQVKENREMIKGLEKKGSEYEQSILDTRLRLEEHISSHDLPPYTGETTQDEAENEPEETGSPSQSPKRKTYQAKPRTKPKPRGSKGTDHYDTRTSQTASGEVQF